MNAAGNYNTPVEDAPLGDPVNEDNKEMEHLQDSKVTEMTFTQWELVAKDVITVAFNYLLSMCLIIYQIIRSNNTFSLDSDNMVAFITTVSCFGYGFILPTVIYIHSTRNLSGDSALKGVYSWTEWLPIIKNFLQIPVSLKHACVVTILMWAGFVVISFLVLITTLTTKSIVDGADAADEIRNVCDEKNAQQCGTIIFSNCIALFHLFCLTGEMLRYYVLNKTAM